MKLVWSPETALEAYIDTVKSCESFKESSIAELLSTMAAGWNAKLIVQAWFHGAPIVTSIGLAIAARHTRGRYVCVVPDEQSRQKYMNAMKEHDEVAPPPEVVVGEAEVAMAGLVGVDFLVVDCKRGDFDRVLRFAKLGQRGAVLACNNSNTRDGNAVSGSRWHGVLERGARVVRSVFLPVEKGLDIAHVGSTNIGGSGRMAHHSRWIRHIDARSGEEHVFRG
ncbi:uncharacterized protein LOC115955198 [Quercus lobata]|uniref:Uncharacterized protein n=1 Tax=Quercus lobata TaxID=97700 RepID=A0A7N2MDE9_QUELO|nr:uncharacterized protein LOC115955198 [Quercus lobata]